MPTQLKLTLILTLLILSSFTTNTFIGTYGVSSADPSQIKLSINADNTFTYQDFSLADKALNIIGA